MAEMLSKTKFRRNKNILRLCLCLLCLGLAGVSGAREIAITILHTADIHGCLESITPEGSDKPVGGLLRCAAEINKIRAQETNVVLIDCGDFIQGSVESYLTGGVGYSRSTA